MTRLVTVTFLDGSAFNGRELGVFNHLPDSFRNLFAQKRIFFSLHDHPVAVPPLSNVSHLFVLSQSAGPDLFIV